MTTWQSGLRPITIAILAMGGEGGGVLADWIVALGERGGYKAQNTSVAGVAQRTGTTVYYVELFPPPADGIPPGGRSEPVLGVFPTPGEVDIVIASELMEAGRAIQRGFSTPDRTLLISSTNRVYAMSEKESLADGRADDAPLFEALQNGSREYIAADFMEMATRSRSVISASLFGALAGSGALPFSRDAFEATISAKGKGIEASLTAFGLGFEAAVRVLEERSDSSVPVSIGRRPPDPEKEAVRAEEERMRGLALSDPLQLVGPSLASQATRVTSEFPEPARVMLLRGCARTAVYQDAAYCDRYLDRVARIAEFEPDPDGEAGLTTEAARHVALWMCYQDTIQVAMQKIRRDRLDRVRAEAKAEPGQLLQVHEYLHPRSEEIADTLPTALGRRLAGSKRVSGWLDRITSDGMVVNTTSAWGYSMLSVMARFRPWRPRSFRFGREQQAIDIWLDLVVETAAADTDLAREILECQRVLKGYGETHAHGSESFASLMSAARALIGKDNAAAVLADLRTAAMADEDGTALRSGLAELNGAVTD